MSKWVRLCCGSNPKLGVLKKWCMQAPELNQIHEQFTKVKSHQNTAIPKGLHIVDGGYHTKRVGLGSSQRVSAPRTLNVSIICVNRLKICVLLEFKVKSKYLQSCNDSPFVGLGCHLCVNRTELMKL